MTAVALIGDTHSDGTFVASVHKQAKRDEVEVIVQLGDFGFTFDANMIASIAAWLEGDENRRWYWIDGNHDQHDYLEHLVEAEGRMNPISMAPYPYNAAHWGASRNVHLKYTQEFPDRLFYVPRGCVFRVGETNVQGLGGAYSIDEHYRAPGISWWPQELITEAEAALAVQFAHDYGPVDVMITHEGPSSAYLEGWLSKFGYKVDPKSGHNRDRLTNVVERVNPVSLYHGHYHERYDTTHKGVYIHGVAANIPTSNCIPGINYILTEW